MGRSGARLSLAVHKQTEHAAAEAAYCEALGPEVAPRVLAVTADGYVMEALCPPTAKLVAEYPVIVEYRLKQEVWNRMPVPVGANWRDALHLTTGISAPSWTFRVETCMTHGDPTLGNTMLRLDSSLVLIDPVPPGRRVPQIRDIDHAKIVQSMMGWEVMTGGPRAHRVMATPDFLDADDYTLHRLAFWTGITMLRAQQHVDHEKEFEVWSWCDYIKGECLRAAGI